MIVEGNGRRESVFIEGKAKLRWHARVPSRGFEGNKGRLRDTHNIYLPTSNTSLITRVN